MCSGVGVHVTRLHRLDEDELKRNRMRGRIEESLEKRKRT